jgi:hypothetical protein
MNDYVSDNDVKIAKLMDMSGASVEEAVEALEKSGGNANGAMSFLNRSKVASKTAYSSSLPELASINRMSHSNSKKDSYASWWTESAKDDSVVDTRETLTFAPSLIVAHNATAEARAENTMKAREKNDGANRDTNIAALRTSRTSRAPLSTAPGAVAVDGINGTMDDDDDGFSWTGQQESNAAGINTNHESPTEPVTARVVLNSEEDYEKLQEQLQQKQQQLDEFQRRQENTVVGQVVGVEHDEAEMGLVTEDESVSQDSDNHGDQTFSSTKPCLSFCCSSKERVIVLVVATLAIIGTAVGIVFATTTASLPPLPPVALPQELVQLLSSVSFDGGTALQTPSTPQNHAAIWLANNTNLDTYSDAKKIQRYVLATLFFSTNGDGWDNNTGWLTDEDECSWYNKANEAFCVNGSILELDMIDVDKGNNLVGTIPNELALLSTSVAKLQLGGNSLTGRIPLEIGLLTKLTFMSLWNNRLTGDIPSELSSLTQLATLDLGSNSLDGNIPFEIHSLSKLNLLWLDSNSLSGQIPSDIHLLSNLLELLLHQNNLSGTIPSEIYNLSSLTTLTLYHNRLTGEFTCPFFIEECLISCDPDIHQNVSTQSCRSL